MVGTGRVGLLPVDALLVQQMQSPLNNELMLLCRARLPEEHPLCAATATSSICQQADSLALLHSRLRTGQILCGATKQPAQRLLGRHKLSR